MTWYTLFTRALTGTAGGNGETFRQAIAVADYDVGAPATGTQIRVSFQASLFGSLNLLNAYTGHAASSGDAVDFDGAQVHLLFTTASTVSIPAGTTVVTDAATLSFDKTKPLVISTAATFPGWYPVLATPDHTYYGAGGDVAGVTDFTASGGARTGSVYPKVEIFRADPAGNPTVTINKSASQGDPTSAASIIFDVIFNKGVTGFTASDIDLSTSTAGGTLVAAITAGLSGGLGYTVRVTGMLTVGNVIPTIPSSVCTSVADGLPNDASTSTDNVVAWDPDIINPLTPNVYEVTVVDRNMLRIEVRDPEVTLGHTQTLTSGDTGSDGTFSISGAASNGYGQIRITTTSAGADIVGTAILGGSGNIFIQNMTASPVSNGIGGQKIRCQIYDTSWLTGVSAPSSLRILHALGTVEGNSSLYFAWQWTYTVIDATHFDLNATTEAVPVPSAFVHAYAGGGVVGGGSPRNVCHSIGGCVEANGGWIMSRSGTTTIDLANSVFTNTYTSGGTLCYINNWVQRPNPTLGNALDSCFITGRYGKSLRFADIAPPSFLNRTAAIVPGDYTFTGGGLTITAVYRKIKPYRSGYKNIANGPIGSAAFRYYLYLQLSGNLTAGSYLIQFPSGTGLPPKTFVYNDKVTRCSSIMSDQNGHRSGDSGKIAYLGQWVPDFGTYGGYDYSAVTNWQIIDSGGSVVYTAGAAPALRTTPISREGTSYGVPSSPVPVRSFGASMKVLAITQAATGVATVDDASSLNNGDLVSFTMLQHWSADGGGPRNGMVQAATSIISGSPVSYRVANKSGNSFDLSCAKAVFSATKVAGGSGYLVGDTITFANGVRLTVATVSAGAVLTVTIIPNFTQGTFTSGTGHIDYPYTLPSNPQSQTSTSGGGSGATFNLTWANNPYDQTVLAAGQLGEFGNPNTSAFSAYARTISGNQGNLLYRVNELGNRTGTYIYGMDYSAATLPAGTYYIYLANRGVSDPIVIRESAWYEVATCYLKGMYHERSGAACDGRFGFVKDVGFKPRAGFEIYKSYMPYAFTNYTNYRCPHQLLDVNVGNGVGGGYDPWVTTTTTPVFGSHVDAGDWDSRINETGWFYWQILDTWTLLSAPVKTSVSNQGTPTLLEAGLDSVIFAGTDSMPSPIVEVIFGIEMYRASQESNGAVIGGMNYGEGVYLAETSSNTTESIYTWYPDHFNTLSYVLVAAKLARVLGTLGYTSLAASYQASAIAAYDWCALMLADATTRDAWYLPVKTRGQWSTSDYNDNMNYLSGVDQIPTARAAAAATLFALTGGSSYKSVCDSFYSPAPSINVALGFGAWEYARAPGATGGVRDAIVVAIKDFVINSLVTYGEAPDVAFASPALKGSYLMGFGGGNNFQFTHFPVMASVLFTEAGTAPDLVKASRARACLENWYGFRHGGNSLGLCMTTGIGVRNNRETLHSDSKNTSQEVPAGLTSEGWANLFPGLTIVLGDSFNSHVQHPQWDPAMLSVDSTIVYRELYPYEQLAWPRYEFFVEDSGAIEHAEFTVQQQTIGAYAAALYLHGWDGNTVTGGVNTSTALLSSLNPASVGVSVTFTATVTPVSGGPATGIVTFRDGGVLLGTDTLDGSGVAQFATSGLTPGSHLITGFYEGDGTYDASTSNTITEVIQGNVSSTALVSSLNPSVLGDSVTFTATVTGSGSPTGTVTFKDSTTTIGSSSMIAGVATFGTSLLAVGTHPITGVYSGDSTFDPSTSNTVSQVVQSAAPPGPITLLPQACM